MVAQVPASKQSAQQWAQQLLATHSFRLQAIEWTPGHGGSASVVGSDVTLVLGEHVLQDAATTRFHIAHEVGHVVLGHLTGLRQRRTRAIGICLVLTVIAEVAAMAAAVAWSWPIVLVPLVLMAAMSTLSRRAVLPLERDADAFAAGHGAPSSSATIPPTPWVSRWLLKTHPTQSERRRRQTVAA